MIVAESAYSKHFPFERLWLSINKKHFDEAIDSIRRLGFKFFANQYVINYSHKYHTQLLHAHVSKQNSLILPPYIDQISYCNEKVFPFIAVVLRK